jgi:hypothetical protein
MATFSSSKHSLNSNNRSRSASPKSAAVSPVLASCYVSSASSTFVQGFHYYTTGTDGTSVSFRVFRSQANIPFSQGYSGVPEVPSGYPSSPPSQSIASQQRRCARAAGTAACSISKGASRAIARECERLLCGDMKRIFLGGRIDLAMNVPRLMGSIKTDNNSSNSFYDDNSDNEDTVDDYLGDDQRDMKFIEVWDYVGGTSFRGFIAHKALLHGQVEKTLFLFFEHVAGTQLKQGYIPLIPRIRKYWY